jgi:photosystem II stability/assembly factor-like uncharacterized protein
VTLPPAGQGAPTIAVDPANHTTIFATGAEGLYKTSDDAATWTLVLSRTAYPVTSRVLSLAISPVDPGLLYVALAGPDISSSFRLVRSKDAGSTWQVLAEPQGALCGWSVSVLEAHRLDAQRAFRSAGCYAGRNFYGRLEQSADQGESWTPIFAPQPGESSTANTSNPKLIYPERLRGATPAMPARFYLAGRRDLRLGGGSSLFRTDDDGATWVDLFSYRGGQTLDQPNAPPATIPGQGYDPNAPQVRIGGLAFDPANPDRIFVGLNEILPSQQPTRTASRVLVSTDAGASWTALGNRDIGLVMDLASGTDGRNLYAATDQGVWRLSLSSESPTVPRDQEK